MATMPGHVHLACRACGSSAVVDIEVHELERTDQGLRLQVDASKATAWADAHHAPYLVPIKACEGG